MSYQMGGDFFPGKLQAIAIVQTVVGSLEIIGSILGFIWVLAVGIATFVTGGIGGELSAWINENYFQYLDAPVVRVASLDTPIPFAPSLEKNFLPKDRLRGSVEKLLKF